MLLQKTFPMNRSMAESKARLAHIESYGRRFLAGTKVKVTSSKTVDFSFRGPLGFQGRTVLLAVEGNSPDERAFESVGGNIAVMGSIDFAEINPEYTEVTLAVHYEIKSRFFAWLDRRRRFMNAFVTTELDRVRPHLEEVAASPAERASVLPVFESVAA